MKLVKTYGETASKAEAMLAAIERRGAANTAKVETVVSTILSDIRHGGDDAVEEYAGRLDGLKQAGRHVAAITRDRSGNG